MQLTFTLLSTLLFIFTYEWINLIPKTTLLLRLHFCPNSVTEWTPYERQPLFKTMVLLTLLSIFTCTDATSMLFNMWSKCGAIQVDFWHQLIMNEPLNKDNPEFKTTLLTLLFICIHKGMNLIKDKLFDVNKHTTKWLKKTLEENRLQNNNNNICDFFIYLIWKSSVSEQNKLSLQEVVVTTAKKGTGIQEMATLSTINYNLSQK